MSTPAAVSKPEYISPQLEKLLSAALGDEAKAVDFYKSWRDEIDFDNISYFEYELLSKVYERLRQVNFQDELTPKIKGISRRTWLENQLYKSELTNFFKILDKAGTDFILLTREPLTYSLKNNSETIFSFRNFQILVHYPLTTEIIKELARAGWQPPEKYHGDKYLKEEDIWFTHGTHLSVGVKLKSHIFGKDAWKFAEVIKFSKRELRILSSADYLLQILEEEFLPIEKRSNPIWLLLTALALRDKDHLDWERLAAKSTPNQVNYALVEMLDAATKLVNSEGFKRSRYKFFTAPPNKLKRVFLAYRSLKKSYQKTGERFSVTGFARFLQRQWQIDSLYQLPWQIGKRLIKF